MTLDLGEFVVFASLYDFSMFHNNDFIAVTDSRQAVSHDYAGASAALDVVQDLFLNYRI